MTETFDLNGLKLLVSKEHRFGTDAMELASFTKVKSGQVVCDLCTGCGIVPFLLISGKAKPRPSKIYAADINDDAIELLRESVRVNELDEIIFPVHEDLKHITQIQGETIDIVTMNPPYYKADDGFKRETGGTARHELLCTLDDAVKAASKLLRFGGRLYMCHIPERLADVICALRTHGLEPKSIKFSANRKDEARLVLVDAKKGGKPGLKVNWECDIL